MNQLLKYRRQPVLLVLLMIGFLPLASCQIHALGRSAPSPTLPPTITPASEISPSALSQAETDSLNSLQKVDEYPLYVMHHQGPHDEITLAAPGANYLQRPKIEFQAARPQWACSLFTTLADPQSGVFGRNFDWEFSPALLLFTHPPEGYASVSMVDLAYLFDDSIVARLTDLDLKERRPLLYTPFMPFDGLNEKGLAIGMAAVPDSAMPYDPNKQSVDSLRIIRMILDQAANVEEGLAIMKSVNILWNSGPPLHYLLADTSGNAALVEFVDGEMIVLYNTNPWHQATNFLLSDTSGSTDGICNRFDLLSERLQQRRGDLSEREAMELLGDVSQSSTQWSVVYHLDSGRISITMGRKYTEVHVFNIGASAPED